MIAPKTCRAVLAAAALLSAPAAAAPAGSPMQFFEGRTEGTGTIRIMLGKPYRTRSIGHGRLEPDGTLLFVQRVVDEGQPPRERRWKIRQTGPRHFSGTMSEAVGPVKIEEVGGRFRFRFKMKGNVSIEQWLVPLAGGKAASNTVTIRKFGVKVGTANETITKVGAGAAR